MTSTTKYQTLCAEVKRLAHAYYVLDMPTASDAVYDSLFRDLQVMEATEPGLQAADSPTQRVGGTPVKDLPSIKHSVPMLSIDNAMNAEEAEAFIRSLATELGLSVNSVVLTREPKYDGLSCSLRYEKGHLTQAVTRGDGEEGEDVTAQVKTIQSVPLVLLEPFTGEVRGEVLMRKADFDRLNQRQRDLGEKEYANPRNAAAGSLRVLDPKVTASRRLSFYAYVVVDAVKHGFTQHDDALHHLIDLGFLVSDQFRVCTGLTEVLDSFNEMATLRANLPYEIDGVVFKLANFKLQDTLGWNIRTPRWAIAYKFPAEEKTTIVEAIEVQVGRTGRLTPVAKLKPVQVGGVTVTNATLHNLGETLRKDVRVGDTVIVRRAGDVIPEILGSLVELRPADSQPWTQVETCPVCGSRVHQIDANHFCMGGMSCDAQRLYRITHFGSRLAMDIEGLGESSVQQMLAAGLIQKASDLYGLTIAALKGLPGWGLKSATNLFVEITVNSVNRPLRRFIMALGIETVGEATAKNIAQTFGTWEAFRAATEAELLAVQDIGPITSDAILTAFNDEHSGPELDRLAKFIQPAPETKKAEGPLTGKTIVVTGTLPSLSREDAKALVEKLGGKPGDSVSKKTFAVIAGESAGSKLTKAIALGVPVYAEAWLLALV